MTELNIKKHPSKKERTKNKIMHIAKGLFEEYGNENVNFQMIADKADMCRTTVFNHFGSMEDLLVALTAQEIEDVWEIVDSKGLKGKDLIYGLFDKFLEDTCCYPYFAGRITAHVVLSGTEENPVKYLEKIIMEALEYEGYDDPLTGAMLIEGVYFGLTAHYYVNGKIFDPETLKAEAHEQIGRILGGKK